MDVTLQDSLASISPPSALVVHHRPLSFGKRCLFALIPLLTVLLTAEIAARCLISDNQRYQQIEQIIVYLGNEPGQSIFEPDPACFWRLKPNTVLPASGGASWGGVMANSHGMRSREVSVAETQDKHRVLCFGDSSTFAFGVGFADAWPNQLQELLDAEHPGTVEVLNAGIPGQTSYQGRQRLARELDKWRPHQAFITFGNNDGWRWDGFSDQEHARRASLLRNLSVLDHSRAWQWLKSFPQAAVREQGTRTQLEWAQQATDNYFDPRAQWTPRVSLEEFAENLTAMVAACRRHDCEPILVVWPDQRQFLGQPTWRPPYQAAMRTVAEQTDTPCLDLVPAFQRAGLWAVQRFLPRDVVHLDRPGNRFVSEAAAELVRDISTRDSKDAANQVEGP